MVIEKQALKQQKIASQHSCSEYGGLRVWGRLDEGQGRKKICQHACKDPPAAWESWSALSAFSSPLLPWSLQKSSRCCVTVYKSCLQSCASNCIFHKSQIIAGVTYSGFLSETKRATLALNKKYKKWSQIKCLSGVSDKHQVVRYIGTLRLGPKTSLNPNLYPPLIH